MSRVVSVKNQVLHLSGMLGTSEFSDWEEDFISSIDVQVANANGETTGLSSKQVEKVEQVYKKYFA